MSSYLHPPSQRYSHTRQSGFVLLITLVMMVAITMVSIAAANQSILGERTAGNIRQRLIASVAAESGLSDALDRATSYEDTSRFSATTGSEVNLTNGNASLVTDIASFKNSAFSSVTKLTTVKTDPTFKVGLLSVAACDGFDGNVLQCMNYEVAAQGYGNDYTENKGGAMVTMAADYSKPMSR